MLSSMGLGRLVSQNTLAALQWLALTLSYFSPPLNLGLDRDLSARLMQEPASLSGPAPSPSDILRRKGAPATAGHLSHSGQVTQVPEAWLLSAPPKEQLFVLHHTAV